MSGGERCVWFYGTVCVCTRASSRASPRGPLRRVWVCGQGCAVCSLEGSVPAVNRHLNTEKYSRARGSRPAASTSHDKALGYTCPAHACREGQAWRQGLSNQGGKLSMEKSKGPPVLRAKATPPWHRGSCHRSPGPCLQAQVLLLPGLLPSGSSSLPPLQVWSEHRSPRAEASRLAMAVLLWPRRQSHRREGWRGQAMGRRHRL